MKKVKWIMVLFCLGMISPLNGQDNVAKEVNDLIRAQIIQEDYLIDKNVSVIEQIGNYNQSEKIQQKVGIQSNSANLNQEGNGNIGYIEQTGSGHTAHINQSGNENEANLRSSGSNIQGTITQTGDGNIITSYIENHGSQLRSAALTQEGNYNKIELSLKGDGFTDRTVEQRVVLNQVGNSHELTVIRDPFSAPIEITQDAGASGEGMTVNVTTSDFSFPMK